MLSPSHQTPLGQGGESSTAPSTLRELQAEGSASNTAPPTSHPTDDEVFRSAAAACTAAAVQAVVALNTPAFTQEEIERSVAAACVAAALRAVVALNTPAPTQEEAERSVAAAYAAAAVRAVVTLHTPTADAPIQPYAATHNKQPYASAPGQQASVSSPAAQPPQPELSPHAESPCNPEPLEGGAEAEQHQIIDTPDLERAAAALCCSAAFAGVLAEHREPPLPHPAALQPPVPPPRAQSAPTVQQRPVLPTAPYSAALPTAPSALSLQEHIAQFLQPSGLGQGQRGAGSGSVTGSGAGSRGARHLMVSSDITLHLGENNMSSSFLILIFCLGSEVLSLPFFNIDHLGNYLINKVERIEPVLPPLDIGHNIL